MAQARKNFLLRAYLLTLCVVEFVSLYRLLVLGEDVTAVASYLITPQGDLFKGLFSSYLSILLVTRLSVLLSEDMQTDVWRFCAAVHAVEALWLVPTALNQGALPASWTDLSVGRHGEALFIITFVTLNALGFSYIFLRTGGRINKEKL